MWYCFLRLDLNKGGLGMAYWSTVGKKYVQLLFPVYKRVFRFYILPPILN